WRLWSTTETPQASGRSSHLNADESFTYRPAYYNSASEPELADTRYVSASIFLSCFWYISRASCELVASSADLSFRQLPVNLGNLSASPLSALITSQPHV